MSKIYSINVETDNGSELQYYFLDKDIKAVDELCYLSNTIRYNDMLFEAYGPFWEYDKDNKFMNQILKDHGIEDFYKPFLIPKLISLKDLPEKVQKDYKHYISNCKYDIMHSDDYLIYTYDKKVKLFEQINNISYIVKDDK